MRICQSCPGSSAFGVVMTTPAMGPATVGASGLELLDSWHPAAPPIDIAAIASARGEKYPYVIRIVTPVVRKYCWTGGRGVRPERQASEVLSEQRGR